MKLRSISLSNVRKFTGQTATISGITDGVSVVAQANEFGKSTFFDALHALFFLKYGSTTREVKSLQPRAGGAVRVSAELELPNGCFTIEKSFLAQKRATVKDAGGAVIALDDEAENWISKLMGSGLEGPAGLLWVRQGITALEPVGSSKAEKDTLLGTRRNLLSSVAGEIDMITGGRRMDRVIAAATHALARLATATGKPVVKGPWKDAELEAEAHSARHAELDRACRELSDALAQRREIAARLAVLEAPGAQDALNDALEHSQAVYDTAQAHADKLGQAQAQAALKQLELEAKQATLDGLLAAAQSFETARAALETATTARDLAKGAATAAQDATDAAQIKLGQASTSLKEASAAKEAAQQDALRRNAAEKHDQLAALLGQIEEKGSALAKAEAAFAALPVTPQALDLIERTSAAHQHAQAEASAGGVQVDIFYEGAGRISSSGKLLEQGVHALMQRQVFELEGIGRMTVDPGAGAVDLAAVEAAQTQAQAALDAVGVPDVASARKAGAKRTEIRGEISLLEGVIKTLAPDGVAPVQAGLAEAKAALEALSAGEAKPHEDAATLNRKREAAHVAEQDARRAYEATRDARDVARDALARANAGFDTAQAAYDAAASAYGDEGSFAARQSEAARGHLAAKVAAEDTRAAVDTLRKAAPDLVTAQADLARAKSAAENIRTEREQLRTRSADLSATIRARAEDGVEEKRDEVAGLLLSAQERAARFAHEAAGLTLLVEALRAKRGAAQEAYFGPVQQELAPLLALLHEDAALSFDPASMLPQGLARGGAEEDMEMLSGGTQEQIAILTRLAFARLFARQGKPMPIILDDALVYSDDSRITAMFTALHRVAADQQVIVFSCRQMAFAGLGGTRPLVEIVQDR